jgi:perosamine synthetase
MIEDMIIDFESPLREALKAIDQAAQGVVFVVDRAKKLCGVATDGDIRRALLRGESLDTPLHRVMTGNCVSLPVTSSTKTIHERLRGRIAIIPLLDDQGRPVDYASRFKHHKIPFASPAFDGNEFSYVTECLETGWISSQGPYVARFEREFAEFTGAEHALTTSNGTTALHLALVALGIGPGDEVIVPNLTFAASAAAVVHAGATPVLVDVRPDDWGIDPQEAEAAITPRTRAIMPVHLYGQPTDLVALAELAERHGLKILEDAAEALGAYYQGRHVGTFGDAAAFSFFGNKLITTGEGGMILFKDPAVAARARMLRDHGMDPQRKYWHLEIGYNYRMTNLQAAVGVAQLERIPAIIARKKAIAARYNQGFRDLAFLEIPSVLPGRDNIYWAFSVVLDTGLLGMSAQDFTAKLASNGIESRPVFFPLHRMPPFAKFGANRRFPVSERLSDYGVSLPSSATIPDEDIDRVVSTVRDIGDLRSLIGQIAKS